MRCFVMDPLTTSPLTERMSRVRGKNTGPELTVRRLPAASAIASACSAGTCRARPTWSFFDGGGQVRHSAKLHKLSPNRREKVVKSDIRRRSPAMKIGSNETNPPRCGRHVFSCGSDDPDLNVV